MRGKTSLEACVREKEECGGVEGEECGCVEGEECGCVEGEDVRVCGGRGECGNLRRVSRVWGYVCEER